MAVKAVAIVKDIVIEGNTSMRAIIKAIINDDTPSEFEISITGTKDQIGNLTAQQFLQQVRNAVQTKMTTDYGFTFTGSDVIRVIGSMD